MKKILLLITLLFSGCATATISTEKTDGKLTKCDATYTSLFLNVDSLSTSACGSKSESTGSKVNAEILKALLTP